MSRHLKIKASFLICLLILIVFVVHKLSYIQEGYSFDVYSKSQIQEGVNGTLRQLTHKNTGLTLVMASENRLEVDISPDWEQTNLATDPMWHPGSCASKPSLFIQNRYIFIDDGKAQDTDHMSTYVIYDLKEKTYTYFGGNRDKSDGDIFKTQTMGDFLMFYIHTPGKIIERKIDPKTLSYSDTVHTYLVPSEVTKYEITKGEKDTEYVLTDTQTGILYVSEYSNKTYTFTKKTFNELNDVLIPDSDLEKKLNGTLRSALPALVKEAPYETLNKTVFSLSQLLSTKTHTLILIKQRFGIGYETPAVYTINTQEVSPVTVTPVYLQPVNYVPLGAYIHD